MLEARSAPLTEILETTACFRVPTYQRGYDWGKVQCRQIYDDVVRIGARDDAMHFLGAITYIDEGGIIVHAYQLIDGQQRLTTLMLLLCALKECINKDSNVTTAQIDQLLFNTGRHEGDDHYKLVLTDNDKSFKTVLDGDQPKNNDRVTSNFGHFKKWLSGDPKTCDVVWHGIKRLNVVGVLIDKSGDAQAIFESMNSTGLALTQTDLIKNFILMPHNKDAQKKIYKNYWMPMEDLLDERLEKFLKTYLKMSIRKHFPETNTYAEFKSWMENKDKGKEAEVLYEYSKHYAILAGVERHTSSEVNRMLGYIREQNASVADTLSLKVLYDLSHDRIKTHEATRIFQLVDSYVLRSRVCAAGKDLNKIFPELISRIDEQNYVKSVESTLMAKTQSSRFPRDTMFKDAIKRFQLYRNKHICEYMLARIEFQDGKERPPDLTIEHIMPQKLSTEWQEILGSDSEAVHEKYLHTIGNLTLTAYNPHLGNKVFSAKRPIYEKSNIGLTRKLAEYEEWTKNTIEKRADDMAERAVKTWLCPQGYDGVNYEVEPVEAALEDEHLEGTGVDLLWNQIKEKILDACRVQFQMEQRYGTFRMTDHKNIVLCSIKALRNQIRVIYNTRVNDGVFGSADPVEQFHRGHDGSGDFYFTLMSDDDIAVAVNLACRVYKHKVSSAL